MATGVAMTDYLENKLIDHLFRNRSFTNPATLYMALYTSATTDTGGGTEVSGGSYARVALNPSDTNWLSTQGTTTGASSGTTGITSNNATITFPAPTGNWGTVTDVAICDTASGGNMLLHGALTASKTVNNGDAAPNFPVAALTVQLD